MTRYVEQLSEIMNSLANELLQSDPIHLNYLIMIFGCKAGVFWNAGLKDFAIEWAAKTTKLTKSDALQHCSYYVITALEMVVQIHFENKLYDLLVENLNALKILARNYLLADAALKRFTLTFRTANERGLVGPLSPQNSETISKLVTQYNKKDIFEPASDPNMFADSSELLALGLFNDPNAHHTNVSHQGQQIMTPNSNNSNSSNQNVHISSSSSTNPIGNVISNGNQTSADSSF